MPPKFSHKFIGDWIPHHLHRHHPTVTGTRCYKNLPECCLLLLVRNLKFFLFVEYQGGKQIGRGTRGGGKNVCETLLRISSSNNGLVNQPVLSEQRNGWTRHFRFFLSPKLPRHGNGCLQFFSLDAPILSILRCQRSKNTMRIPW